MGLLQIPQQKVWRSRAWRKSFPERFGISAYVESYFPNGLAFLHLGKVVSRKVWSFRAWRESFPEWFDACGPPATHFLKDFVLAGLPQIVFKGFVACGPPATFMLKAIISIYDLNILIYYLA